MRVVNVTVDYYLATQTDVPMILTSEASLTPANAGKPNLGQWFCQSPYLGKTYAGNYYVKKVAMPQCTESEQVWMGACPSYVNPVAFFFDDKNLNGYPFLMLEAFDFSGNYGTRYGRILITPAIGNGGTVVWKPA